MDEEEIFYLALSLITILILFATLPAFGKGWSLLAALLGVLAAGFIVMMNWADFVILPFVTKTVGVTFQPAKDYQIPKSQDTVLKNVSGLYYATGFLTANLFAYTFKEEQMEENPDEKLAMAAENWEKAVMSLNFPFKFHAISVGNDVQTIRDELEGRRSYQEFQLNRALQNQQSANETVLTDIRRKISVIQAKIDRISGGEKPISSLMYVETTAVGISEKAAADNLSAQLKQLQVALSSLDLQLTRVVGRELYTLFRFNFSMPTKVNDLESQFTKEG